jgi:hypothetical protein
MKSKLYAGSRTRLRYGGFFTLSILVQAHLLSLNSSFSYFFFFLSFFWMSVTALSGYYFLKALVSPVIQIYPNELIIFKAKRKKILQDQLKSITQEGSTVTIIYLQDGVEKKVEVDVELV